MSETTRLPIFPSFILSPTGPKITITLPHSIVVAAIAVAAFSSAIFAGPMLGLRSTAMRGACMEIRETHKELVGGEIRGETGARELIIHAHRGGAGMRAESTLYAFAYGIDIGADAIEMDTLFTKDGIPVIWHDFTVDADKCTESIPGSGYLGKYVNQLTLAELKTLECGSQQSEKMIQAQTFPGAQIQTLEEVLEFVKCYDTSGRVDINLETKIDEREPNMTWPLEKYLTDLVPIIQKHDMTHRVIIQSFDWRTLAIKDRYPFMRTTALIDETMIPFNEEKYNADWVMAASMTGADCISPSHGSPNANGDWTWTIHSPAYVPMTTKEVVEKSHRLGMKVVPWTVDDESTVVKIIGDGVDGIISNYPMRISFIAHALGLKHNLSKHWRRADYDERVHHLQECILRAAKQPSGSGLRQDELRAVDVSDADYSPPCRSRGTVRSHVVEEVL